MDRWTAQYKVSVFCTYTTLKKLSRLDQSTKYRPLLSTLNSQLFYISDCKSQSRNHQQLGRIPSIFDNMEPIPSCTLYINNINEKIKQDVVKKMLYMVFSQYGKVTDVIAKKGLKLRGQAWVVFENESSAITALRGKQGFSFYEKPLVSL